jgi:hypothetical protein
VNSKINVFSVLAFDFGAQAAALVEAGLARRKEAIFDVRMAAREKAAIYHFLW